MMWDEGPYGCGLSSYRCRKTKKRKCGMEGENVVAYGRLPSPAPNIKVKKKKGENVCLNRKILIEDRTVKSVVKLYNFIIHYL